MLKIHKPKYLESKPALRLTYAYNFKACLINCLKFR